jgi:hypothetical protein
MVMGSARESPQVWHRSESTVLTITYATELKSTSSLRKVNTTWVAISAGS